MKKIILAVAVLAMAFTACNSVDSAIDDIAAGCKANDKEAVKEAIKDLYEAAKDDTSETPQWKLTDEQEKKLEEAIKDCGCYWEAGIAAWTEIAAEQQK